MGSDPPKRWRGAGNLPGCFSVMAGWPGRLIGCWTGSNEGCAIQALTFPDLRSTVLVIRERASMYLGRRSLSALADIRDRSGVHSGGINNAADTADDAADFGSGFQFIVGPHIRVPPHGVHIAILDRFDVNTA
jgi:hypothetical protein